MNTINSLWLAFLTQLCFYDLSLLFFMAVVHLFKLLYNITLYEYTSIYWAILLTDSLVIFKVSVLSSCFGFVCFLLLQCHYEHSLTMKDFFSGTLSLVFLDFTHSNRCIIKPHYFFLNYHSPVDMWYWAYLIMSFHNIQNTSSYADLSCVYLLL